MPNGNSCVIVFTNPPGRDARASTLIGHCSTRCSTWCAPPANSATCPRTLRPGAPSLDLRLRRGLSQTSSTLRDHDGGAIAQNLGCRTLAPDFGGIIPDTDDGVC